MQTKVVNFFVPFISMPSQVGLLSVIEMSFRHFTFKTKNNTLEPMDMGMDE